MQLQNRVIPVLTVANEKLVKTVGFKKPNYIGDPVNAVKIFNDKMVDELVLLDITATIEGREPNFDKIEEICSEAFMPFAYGGGIKNLEQIKRLFGLGIEKVIINTALASNLRLVEEAVNIFGSQSIVASVDVRKGILTNKKSAYHSSGKKKVKLELEAFFKKIELAGVGELFLNSIDRDGTYKGYDLDLIRTVSSQIDIPLVACGGAASLADLKLALDAGASAVAAASIFVYRSESKGILINYPSPKELKKEVFN